MEMERQYAEKVEQSGVSRTKKIRASRLERAEQSGTGRANQSGAELHITCKRIVDGFQADTICEEGYTYALMFRHDIMPNSGQNGLFDLHGKVFHLIQKLNHEWTRLFMDNLYNQRTLAGLAYKEKALAHRVARIHQLL